MQYILSILTLFILIGANNQLCYGQNRPNVLMILIDDLNDFPKFMDVYPDAKTPHMDQLASEGITFTNAHAQYPLCGPSRASLMSGLLPSTLNYTGHMRDEDLEARCKQLGTTLLHQYFSEHGYKTLAVGKICHHHVPAKSVDLSGGRGGFSESTGKLKKNWHQNGTSTDWAAAPKSDNQLPDHAAAQWAVEQLQDQQNQPFFMMVGFLRPHVPWYVPQKWYDLYPDKQKLQLPPYRKNDLQDVPEIAKKISLLPQMPRTDWAIKNDQWHHIIHAYLACTSFTDFYVGQVLSALEKSPYRNNTIVILLSDHGYHLGEKNTFQKHSLWQRSSHVPLVIKGPKINKNQRCDRAVGLLDIYPTLVDMCHLPKNQKNEGHSLSSLINDPNKTWPYPAITQWMGNNIAIQNDRYRYICYEDGSEELYDHDKDPNEWDNLAMISEHNPIKEAMKKHFPSTKFSSSKGSKKNGKTKSKLKRSDKQRN